MKHHAPAPHPLDSLNDLTTLLAGTVALRQQAVAAILAGRPVPAAVPAAMAQALADLEEALDREDRAELDLGDDQTLLLDLSEETRQMQNDVTYLEQGREALLKQLAKKHHGFRDAVRRGLKEVAGHGLNVLLYDYDTALRMPGQRFATAVQPAWNAVALTRFAMARARQPVLWTEAPLSGPGITGLAVVPPHTFAYAASLGREYRDAEGHESAAPLSREKTELLASINARLAMLLADPSWRPFAFVGSGIQFRQGETIIARQDDLASIHEDASLALLEHVHDIVDAVDPERLHFRVEDDGQDVAITPTATSQDLWREFTPVGGLRTADTALGLNLAQGPHLICCGGPWGLVLLEALTAFTADISCIFITDRDDLGRQAMERCPKTTVVAHPDIAAAIVSAAAP